MDHVEYRCTVPVYYIFNVSFTISKPIILRPSFLNIFCVKEV